MNCSAKTFLQETYDFALVQPFDYILVAEHGRYRPIVKVKRDLTAIFVTLDAELLTLADLQNRHLALPPLTSAISILGLNILREAKLKDIQVSYYRNHFSRLQSVIIGNTDACITNSIPIENFAKEFQINFRSFYESRALPHILFIAHERISSEEFDQVHDALIGLSNTPEGVRILAGSGWPEGFEIATDEQYDVVRNLDRRQ